jgi:hypothetical protein
MTTADYTQAHPNTTTNTILTVGNLKEAASDLDHLAELAEWAATIGVER